MYLGLFLGPLFLGHCPIGKCYLNMNYAAFIMQWTIWKTPMPIIKSRPQSSASGLKDQEQGLGPCQTDRRLPRLQGLSVSKAFAIVQNRKPGPDRAPVSNTKATTL